MDSIIQATSSCKTTRHCIYTTGLVYTGPLMGFLSITTGSRSPFYLHLKQNPSLFLPLTRLLQHFTNCNCLFSTNMTETHKNNGTLLLRDHLFRSPTWDCGETVVLLSLSEYHSFKCSECHDNIATGRETYYITGCLLGRKTAFQIRVLLQRYRTPDTMKIL